MDETPARARPLLERAAELYRRLGDPLGLGLSLARLGRVLALMGRFEQAEAALSEAQPLLERTGLPKAPVYYFFNLAYLKSLSGDPLAARVDAGTPEREQGRLWFWLGWIVSAVPVEAAAANEHAVKHYRRTDDTLDSGFRSIDLVVS